jgi:NAD(P)-dependent dehydrogenase (short-subunit alcohol dehydrogenase family)
MEQHMAEGPGDRSNVNAPDVGPVALVTGGSRGIGAACVRRLAGAGYRVVFSGRDAARVREAEAKFEHLGPVPPLGVALDAAHPTSGERLVSTAIERFGQLDTLIANAGTYLGKSLEDTTDEDWARLMELNLTGVFRQIRAALPWLRRSAGYAIAIGSISGTRGYGYEAAYGASKRALRVLTESTFVEAASDGVRATIISPAVVRTRMSGGIFGDSHGPDGDAQGVLFPEDVAATVMYLLELSAAARIEEIVLHDSRWIHDRDTHRE